MKLIFAILSTVAALAASSCKPETQIAGQPISHWIACLEDAHPQTRKEAWRQLSFASDEDIRRNKSAIEKIADGQSEDAERAVWLLFEKLGEEPKIQWIAVYVRGIYSYPEGSARALKQLEVKDKMALVSALEKYISDPSLNYVTDYKGQAVNHLKEMNKTSK